MRAIGLSFFLLAASPAFANEMLSVYDRTGTLFLASNRVDGASSFIHLQSSNRVQGILWERSHYDSYMERMTSVAIDPHGNFYAAGVRLHQGAHYIWLMKFARNGTFLWERADTMPNCTAFSVVANEAGEAWVAGSCLEGERVPVRLLRFSPEGHPGWAQNFDEGGRNFLRNLSVDFIDRATLTIQVNTGAPSEHVRTAVYSRHGSRIATY